MTKPKTFKFKWSSRTVWHLKQPDGYGRESEIYGAEEHDNEQYQELLNQDIVQYTVDDRGYPKWQKELKVAQAVKQKYLIKTTCKRRDLPKDHPLFLQDGAYEVNYNRYLNTYLAPIWCETVQKCLVEQTGIKNIQIKFEKAASPQYYNYGGDTALFTLEIAKKDIEAVKRNVFRDKEKFDTFLHDTYSSYDGFSSYMPNHVGAWQALYDDLMGSDKVRGDNDFSVVALFEYLLLQPDVNFSDTYEYALMDNSDLLSESMDFTPSKG